MTQSSRKLDVKDTCIKLIPKYTYFMHKLHRAINNLLTCCTALEMKMQEYPPKTHRFPRLPSPQ